MQNINLNTLFKVLQIYKHLPKNNWQEYNPRNIYSRHWRRTILAKLDTKTHNPIELKGLTSNQMFVCFFSSQYLRNNIGRICLTYKIGCLHLLRSHIFWLLLSQPKCTVSSLAKQWCHWGLHTIFFSLYVVETCKKPVKTTVMRDCVSNWGTRFEWTHNYLGASWSPTWYKSNHRQILFDQQVSW